jgi:hypothetical protein
MDMVNKRFCDFCGNEITPYENDITEDDIQFNSKIRPGYGGEVKLSIKVCASKEAFGDKSKKDICKKCLKDLIKQL